MKILVTGASGFLGSALTAHWAGAGYEVIALVRPSSSLKRLQGLPSNARVYSICDESQLTELFAQEKPDICVHTVCAYGRNGESPLQMMETNFHIGALLLQAVLDSGSKVVVLNTGTILNEATNFYALSKKQFSQWGAYVAKHNADRLQFIDVLLQHMFGPGDDPSKFSTYVIKSCKEKEKIEFTAGTQRRDFIYIDDVVSAYDEILKNSASLNSADSVDVGSGVAPTIKEFVQTVHRLTNSKSLLQFGVIPHRAGDEMEYIADTGKLRSWGWKPAHDLESGLLKTIEKDAEK